MTFGRKSQEEKLNVLNDSLLLPTYYVQEAGLCGIRSYFSTENYLYALEAGGKWSLPKGYSMAFAFRHDYNKDKLHAEDYSLDDNSTEGIYKKLIGSLIFEKTTGLLRFKINASLTGNKYERSTESASSSVRFNYNSLLRLVFSPKSELILTGSRETSQIELSKMADFPVHLAYDRIQMPSSIHSPLSARIHIPYTIVLSIIIAICCCLFRVCIPKQRETDWLMPHNMESQENRLIWMGAMKNGCLCMVL